MARVSRRLSAIATLQIKYGGVLAASSLKKSVEGLPKSNTKTRIWLRSGPDNKTPVADRSPAAGRSSYRLRTHSLSQGLSYRVPSEPIIIRHGVDDAARHRPDLQTHPDLVILKDKGEIFKTGTTTQIRAKQNDVPLPPSRPDPAKRGLHKTDPLRMDADLVHRGLHTIDLLHTDTDLVQIFIKLIEGKHFCMRVSKEMSIHALKKEIHGHLGTPAQLQNLIYSGYSMQDNQTLQYYGIAKDSTIILNL